MNEPILLKQIQVFLKIPLKILIIYSFVKPQFFLLQLFLHIGLYFTQGHPVPEAVNQLLFRLRQKKRRLKLVNPEHSTLVNHLCSFLFRNLFQNHFLFISFSLEGNYLRIERRFIPTERRLRIPERRLAGEARFVPFCLRQAAPITLPCWGTGSLFTDGWLLR